MNGTREAATLLVTDLVTAFEPLAMSVDAAVFVPFPYLHHVGGIIRASGLMLGAQQVSAEANGAFTGQVSAEMLLDVGVQIVIIGHSECRKLLAESDELIGEKVAIAVSTGLSVMLCVGETWEERQAGQAEAVCLRQISAALKGIHLDHMGAIHIAYEPIWAIGTGLNASEEQAEEMHSEIRYLLAENYSNKISGQISIIYGGSCNTSNAAQLFACPNVDGALVGGASLDKFSFIELAASLK